MEREPIVGECLVITQNSGIHTQDIGERIIVTRVDDNDSTLQGFTRSKTAVGWIPWGDVEPVAFGWEYARRHLPPYLTRLLDACDGIEFISLNSSIKGLILDSLPDWRRRVDEAVDNESDLSGEAVALHGSDEDEDDDDESDDDDVDVPF